MRDRQPTYPGRVQLNPVPGQENVYDMEMADEPTEPGTPLTKANLLSDDTAALLGLSGDPTVDDAFHKLSDAAMISKVPKYTEMTLNLATAVVGDVFYIPIDGVMKQCMVVELDYNGSGNKLVWLADPVGSANYLPYTVPPYPGTGFDTLCNSLTNLLPENLREELVTVNVPCVETYNSTTLTSISRNCFLPSMSEFGFTNAAGNAEGQALAGAAAMKAQLTAKGQTIPTRTPSRSDLGQYICVNGTESSVQNKNIEREVWPVFALSSDVSAVVTWYTDGTNNYAKQEYVYAAIDAFGNDIGGFTKISTGSYIGTGTTTAGNANSLTFWFQPKLLFIQLDGTTATDADYRLLAPYGVTYAISNNVGGTGAHQGVTMDWQGNTVLWHSTTAEIQLNALGMNYIYVAIG